MSSGLDDGEWGVGRGGQALLPLQASVPRIWEQGTLRGKEASQGWGGGGDLWLVGRRGEGLSKPPGASSASCSPQPLLLPVSASSSLSPPWLRLFLSPSLPLGFLFLTLSASLTCPRKAISHLPNDTSTPLVLGVWNLGPH